ncbi:uncharacterized protein LOC129595964 [Paramacrobiotus metropolitanus]|uniref:uncharacterized protein LOC129595964 n=1 Tax=Paramacrobiotus metropolitanus TaxID=2943436 RepID=UPI002445E794|nr:uncharacterized protein LOC129595964 [Paramacrobiotus metropolitanus]
MSRMSRLCFALFVCGMLAIPEVSALKCYVRHNVGQDDKEVTCPPPTDRSLTMVCVKTTFVQDANNADRFLTQTDTKKGCRIHPDARLRMECVSGGVNDMLYEHCYCNTDLCNSAVRRTAMPLLGLGIMAAVVFRWL